MASNYYVIKVDEDGDIEAARIDSEFGYKTVEAYMSRASDDERAFNNAGSDPLSKAEAASDSLMQIMPDLDSACEACHQALDADDPDFCADCLEKMRVARAAGAS